ncbi:DUF1848 domain-containing protein [Ruminococcus sp. Marseille-P6503]|uniref:DUF1848 domain-containing protein n=1 Tax=Ruminococcus sp. Marseille-P6503 TaxID=2364796 RepID=UPI000F52F9EE|nr:DUF1848 domain-containing protein [Ruminococcus sp. Marseille-P6503]
MIISASRRTDIPAFYSEWFFNRIKAGDVLVRNPMNTHQISRIKLTPDVVDCIVFWTKNPKPMLERLDELKDYNYYFQFTLNSYAKDIEPSVPSKDKELIQTFKSLSDKIGKERVIWRYDPIIVNEKYTAEYHFKYFEKLAEILDGKFGKCVISFVDYYKKNATNFKNNNISELSFESIRQIAKAFSEIAKRKNFTINTCAEEIDLSEFGIEHGKCIDDKLIEKLAGGWLSVSKDKNQRDECGCVESIDIGVYNTCLHECKYCYANYSKNTVLANFNKYDANSPLLCSFLGEDDKITDRKVKSMIDTQLKMWM